MQPSDIHAKLLSQIQQTLGEQAFIPDNLEPLIHRISETYVQSDQEQKHLNEQVALRTEQLMASTSRAYSFLDSLNMGLIMCDVNPEVVLTNQPLQKMLASKTTASTDLLPPQTAKNMWNLATIDTLLKPELELRILVTQSLSTNKPIECSEVNVGAFVLRWFIAPMVNEVKPGDKQQIGVIILVEDITEQKMLERSKDEFLSIASHELRTPLTVIRGNSAIIKKYYAANLADTDVAGMIEDIHESSIRLIGIVNDFLDVSALEQGKMRIVPESFTLVETVDNVSRELQNLCETKGISLICDDSIKTMPPVIADKQRIKQVIYNLVGNAVKFTEEGNITISMTNDENFVYTSVSDTGRGMSDEGQRLLFRKFQQAGSSLLTRDTTKGTGLGLYISKLIVEISGGTIKLDHSEVGKGSTFVFSLPRTPPSPSNSSG